MAIEFTSSMVPLPETPEERAQFGHLVDRGPSEEWSIPFAPIVCDAPGLLDWRVAKRGPNVFIPVFPYRVPAGSCNSALGFSFQLAVRLMAEARNVRRLHLVLGEPMEDLGRFWRFWLGVGVICG